ncbi:MAG: MurR/RpiR family transcriptional regulator [Pontibacterium sp.]
MGRPKSKRTIPNPPETYEKIVNQITEDYDELSERYKQVARYLTQNPTTVAMDSVNAVAEKCGVHPSVLVRFAQTFGYSGFKQMQQVFQSRLATAAPGYEERVNALEKEVTKSKTQGLQAFMQELVVRDIATLQELMNTVTEEMLTQAAQLLKEANTVYVMGQLRSEPIASFFRYLMTMLGKPVIFLDCAGGLAPEVGKTMRQGDVLFAISFRHYAKETIALAEFAKREGIPVVGMTDSTLSPLAKDADVLFTVPEEEYSFSRSLAAPMSLAQSIALATAGLMEPKTSSPRLSSVTEVQKAHGDHLGY